MSTLLPWMMDLAILCLIIICTYLEFKHKTIPVWPALITGVIGLILKCFFYSPAEELLEAMMVIGILLFVFVLPVLKQIIDRGDFAVIVGIGLIKGLVFTLFFLFTLALVSGTIAFLTLIWKGGWEKYFSIISKSLKSVFRKKEDKSNIRQEPKEVYPFEFTGE